MSNLNRLLFLYILGSTAMLLPKFFSYCVSFCDNFFLLPVLISTIKQLTNNDAAKITYLFEMSKHKTGKVHNNVNRNQEKVVFYLRIHVNAG